MPGYKAFDEPLRREGARAAGAEWRTYIEPDEERPELEQYLRRVLSGSIGVSRGWHFQAYNDVLQLKEHMSARKMVIKLIRANRLLHWLHRRFHFRGLLLTIRHPCAVVASMLRHGNWDWNRPGRGPGETPLDNALHNSWVPDALREKVAGVLGDDPSLAKVLATTWCLDYYVPFYYQDGGDEYPWILTTYERLVTLGASELERICSALGCRATPEAKAQLQVPSSTVKDTLYEDSTEQLSKWRRNLTPEQVGDVLEVVDAFGLTFYTEALEPDYTALGAFQQARDAW